MPWATTSSLTMHSFTPLMDGISYMTSSMRFSRIAILENLMLDVMYEIPSISGVKECIVSEEVVAQGKQPILVYENEAELA